MSLDSKDPLFEAGVQAILEIKSGMLIASGKAMERHGDDPHAQAIMASAIAMMVGDIDRGIHPGFREYVKRLLDKH